MFDLIANIMAFFYSVWPSYGASIVLLTVTVMVVFTPLTIKSTKSMLEMRRVQPEIKRVQAQYKDDRVKLNEEMMKLYQEHNINPLGGCLPMLFQLPVFFVMFQVLRGLTRRTSSLGWATGNVGAQAGVNEATSAPGAVNDLVLADAPVQEFNPEYISTDSEMYKDLSESTTMDWLGIDLSQSASKMLGESFVEAIPYLIMILIVAVLGWWQQQQIQGRNVDAAQNPQQQMLMRIMPFFLPIISFTMQAALVVYFIASSLIRVGQQAWITHRVYAPIEAMGPIEVNVLEEDEEEPAAPAADSSSPAPKGLAALFGGGAQQDTSNKRHGRRRPTTGPAPKAKAKPPKASAPKATQSQSTAKSKPTESAAKAAADSAESGGAAPTAKPSIWSRFKSEPAEPATEPKAAQPSARVTPKGEQRHSSSKKKRKKRK